MPGRKKRSETVQDFIPEDKCFHLESEVAVMPFAILQMIKVKVGLNQCITIFRYILFEIAKLSLLIQLQDYQKMARHEEYDNIIKKTSTNLLQHFINS